MTSTRTTKMPLADMQRKFTPAEAAAEHLTVATDRHHRIRQNAAAALDDLIRVAQSQLAILRDGQGYTATDFVESPARRYHDALQQLIVSNEMLAGAAWIARELGAQEAK